MVDLCEELPEPGTRVRVLFLNRHWVEGTIASHERVDGVAYALVRLDPSALKDWEVMVDLGGPIELVRPLELRRRGMEMLIVSAA
jgi:hypothetical protein